MIGRLRAVAAQKRIAEDLVGNTEPLELAGILIDLELADAIPSISTTDEDGYRRRQAWLVVRLFTEPIGLVVLDLPGKGLDAADVLTQVIERCGRQLTQRLIPLGLGTQSLSPSGVTYTGIPPFVSSRAAVLADAPACTAVVCTRERPDVLRRALESVAAQRYPQFQVLVVDNAPRNDETRRVVEGFESRLSVRYTVEPRPGLSRARNHALRQVTTPLIAWLDDDEEADVFWLAELARGFHAHPAAAAVSGVVVPGAVDSIVQVWFEQFGGHSKGRGFVSDVFSARTHARQSPLYPLPPFGVGANMAFRTDALRDVGGFDEALGAGTLTKGGEDTKVFTQLLRSSATIVYQPSALVRHFHRADLPGLREQLEGYGTGLTAFYTALIVDDPSVLWPLVKLAPRAILDLMSTNSPRVATLGKDFPTDLLAVNRRAMLVGPVRYLSERFRRGTQRAVVSATARAPS